MNGLAGVDLNLVVALHALLEERSVTAAARRVGLSQPAMSHALGRLRTHFDDPLLIRSGRQMNPTALALNLLEPLRSAVAQLESVMNALGPDPAQLRSTVRLVTDDGFGITELPRLVHALVSAAPGLDLEVLPRGAPGRKALVRRGQAELALGYFSGAGMDLQRSRLFDEDWLCVFMDGHPALDGPWIPEVWADLSHVVVSPTGGRRGVVDRVLAEHGLERRVGLTVPHFSTALAVVCESLFTATLPARVVRRLAPAFGLAMRPTPLPLPGFEVSMLWHARTDQDPAQRWVREQIRGAFADAAGAEG